MLTYLLGEDKACSVPDALEAASMSIAWISVVCDRLSGSSFASIDNSATAPSASKKCDKIRIYFWNMSWFY